MIARLDLAAIEDLKEALPHFVHGPLAHLSYLTRDQVDSYWLDEITQDLADESSIAFASRNSEYIDGLVVYGDSSWDTKVVKRRVAVIRHLTEADSARDSEVLGHLLDEISRHAAGRGIECLTCKVQARYCAGIHALERQGFFLMDTVLDFLFDSSRAPLENISLPKQLDSVRIRLAKPEELPDVLKLNEKAFARHFGRYHSDPKMPPGTGAKVYDQWVRSSFEGWADWILVAEVNDTIAGYAAWKKASALEVKHPFDIAHCPLVAIHPDFFGRGLFTALVLEGMRMVQGLANHLDTSVHVSNYPVHRGLLKLGWKITGARHSFHKWLQ
jgi:dTDP-4-amino-4,6-dideoxy-D-galactose acyltransferase